MPSTTRNLALVALLLAVVGGASAYRSLLQASPRPVEGPPACASMPLCFSWLPLSLAGRGDLAPQPEI